MVAGRVRGAVGIVVVAAVGFCGACDDAARVDATTSTAGPAARPSVASGTPARAVWSAAHPPGFPVVVDGAYTVIATRHGVSVRDSADGRERWHYFDPGHALTKDQDGGEVRTGGGHLVVRYTKGDGQLVRVFDLAGGRPLRTVSTPDTGDTAIVDTATVYVVPGGEPSETSPGSGLRPVRAVGLGDGRDRWRFTPRCTDGNPATRLGAVLTGEGKRATLVVTEGCTVESKHPASVVTGVSAATGRTSWRTGVSAEIPVASPDRPPALPAGTPLRLTDGTGRITSVDTTTGKAATTPVTHAVADSAAGAVTSWPDGWCTDDYYGPITCYDKRGKTRWHRPLPGGRHADRHPVGVVGVDDRLCVVTYASTGAPSAESGWKEHFTTTVAVLRRSDGSPVGGARALPGATTTVQPSIPGQFDLNACDSSGLYVSTLSSLSVARLYVYR